MNEIRRDPITAKWVIVDKEIDSEKIVRKLQSAVLKAARQSQAAECDFCPGHENRTPPSVMELSNGQYVYQKQTPDWQVRVVPNNHPVFRIEGELNRRSVRGYDVMDALGAHEMIIEHRNHVDWDQIPSEDVAAILGVYLERMKDLSKDERFGHLFLFKNCGRQSNSTMSHPNSTLIASPSVPERVRRELNHTRQHYNMKERCLFCDVINEELRQKNGNTGVVKAYQNFVTVCPFFASHPFETWVLPRKHSSDYRTLDRGVLPELAKVIQENLKLIKAIFGPLSYTLLLFTRPNKIWGGDRDYWTTIDSDYHWHFKFFPRFPKEAGFHRNFSAGSGYMVNQIPPETAAQLLRNQLSS
jgi:UDPglucose--hexose-1-phosphate uridylyltransferase